LWRLLLLLLLSGLLVALLLLTGLLVALPVALLATLSRILLLLTRLLILLAALVFLAALVWIAHVIASGLSVIDACRQCPWPMMRSACAYI
jgi:hypothetical protein